ncbi:MAG: HEAT repeat domain-containing protein [Planctomycetes bacterium]|nr:HEAT repeat domain-containing protein [Planctomycetota bacterium]
MNLTAFFRLALAAPLAATLCAACSVTSDPFPLDTPLAYSDRIANQDALLRADEAETRGNFREAGMWMDRYALQDDAILDEVYWFQRASIADRGADIHKAIEVREHLLELRPQDVKLRLELADGFQQVGRDLEAIDVLDVSFDNAEDQLFASQALVELFVRFESYAQAAEVSERIAAGFTQSGEDHAAKMWWQRASSLHEQNGDLRAATIAMENALKGVELAEEERLALARLRAFELGEPETVADAVGLLRYHPDADTRLAGARYLAKESFTSNVATFEMALLDPDSRVQRIALAELAKRSERGKVQPVLPLLESESAEIRIAALRAVAALGTLENLPALRAALVPEDRAQFRAARNALQEVTKKRLSEEMDPELEERRKLRELWLAWEPSQLPN